MAQAVQVSPSKTGLKEIYTLVIDYYVMYLPPTQLYPIRTYDCVKKNISSWMPEVQAK